MEIGFRRTLARRTARLSDLQRRRVLRSDLFPLALCLLALAPVPAASADVEAEIARFEAMVEKARSLCHGILVGIKEVESAYPAPDLAEADRVQAGRSLSGVAVLVGRFHGVEGEARDLRTRVDDLIGASQGAADRVDRRNGASKRLETCSDLVSKFYGRAVGRFGAPPPGVEIPGDDPIFASPAQAGGRFQVSGEVRAGLGSSSYERPHAPGGGFDQSASLLEGSIDARARLRNGTLLNTRVNRETRVDRREITRTEIAAGAEHTLSPGLRLHADVGHEGYDDGLNDAADFGETRLNLGGDYATGGSVLSAEIDRRSRSFDAGSSDYSVTKLEGKGRFPAGGGTLLALLARVSRDAKGKGADLNILNPVLTYTSPSGREAHVSLERFDDPDADSRDNSRIHAHYYFGRAEGSNRSRVGPEIELHTYPNLPDSAALMPVDPGFLDVGIGGSGTALSGGGPGGKRGSHRFRVYFRKFAQEEAFNHVAFSWRKQTSPGVSGASLGWGVTGTAYVESSDFEGLGDAGPSPSTTEIFQALGDLVQAFQTTRAPHVIDAHLRYGWRWRRDGALRTIEVGPALGHRMFIDDERDELQGKAEDLAALLPDSLTGGRPLGDTDFLARNTINRARWGVRLAAELVPAAGALVRAAIQYDADLLYNADPVATTKSLDLRVAADVPLRPDLVLEGTVSHHASGVGDRSPNDFNRTEAALRIRYLFDAAFSH
jgi:hypothetical protein